MSAVHTKPPITITTPDLIYPVLLHLNRQRLIDEIVLPIPADHRSGYPRISITLQGLVHQPWELLFTKGTIDGRLVIKPQNPPLAIIPRDTIDNQTETRQLCVNIDDESYFHPVKIAPDFALPNDPEAIMAVAALVFPNDPQVTNFVRMAWNRYGKNSGRFGFPEHPPVSAGEIIYDEFASRGGLSYSYEPAPSSPILAYQLVRTPSQVLTGGNGTCIDLTAFFSGCLEYIRRLPIILGFTDGGSEWHVVAGVKTNDLDFGKQPVITELQRIKAFCRPERVHLFDLVDAIRLIPVKDTDDAVRQKLGNAKAAFLLDIQAIRDKGILPMPLISSLSLEPRIPTPVLPIPAVHYPSGIPSLLINDISAGKCILLIGDVLHSGAKNSRAVFEQKISELAGIGDKPDTLYAYGLLQKKHTKDELTRLVLPLLAPDESDGRAIYQRLKDLRLGAIISLYPDPLLELVLGAYPTPFKIMTKDEDLSVLSPETDDRELFLLAGSGLTGAGLLLKQSDYDQQVKRLRILGRKVRFHLETNTLLVIGCDLNDINIQKLYLSCISTLPPGEIRSTYFVGELMRPNYAANFRHIDLPAQELISRLAQSFSRPIDKTKPSRSSSELKAFPNPFKNLDFFGTEDSAIFFGREHDSEELYRELMASPGKILTLFGRSGVGKTSLILAGLAPRLRHEGLLTPIYCRFGNDPQEAIINALLHHYEIPNSDFRYELAEIPGILSKYSPDSKGIVIMMDQTEEAFFKLGQRVLSSFFLAVGRLLSHGLAQVRFVFIIREDYVGHLSAYKDELPDLFLAPRALMELSRKAAERALSETAKVANIEIEDGLKETILTDLSPDVILPAHLQIICSRMFAASRHKWDFELYDRLGRTSKMLKEYLADTLSKIAPELVEKTKSVLKVLVTSERTKQVLSLQEIKERTGIETGALSEIIISLIHSHRLVRELKGEVIRYELTHESLTEPISLWMDTEDVEIRKRQEVLSQEISNAQKFPQFEFPKSKLSLILEYKDRIVFDEQAIWVIIRQNKELLSDLFWKEKVAGLSFLKMMQLLFDLSPTIGLTDLTVFFLEHQEEFYALVDVELPEEIKDEIIQLIRQKLVPIKALKLYRLSRKNNFTSAFLRAYCDEVISRGKIWWFLLLAGNKSYTDLLEQTGLAKYLGEQLPEDEPLHRYLSVFSMSEESAHRIAITMLNSDEEQFFNYEFILDIIIQKGIVDKVIAFVTQQASDLQAPFFSALAKRLTEMGLFIESSSPPMVSATPGTTFFYDVYEEYPLYAVNPEMSYFDAVDYFFSTIEELFIFCFSFSGSFHGVGHVVSQLSQEFRTDSEFKKRYFDPFVSMEFTWSEHVELWGIFGDRRPDADELEGALELFLEEFWEDFMVNYFYEQFYSDFNASFNRYLTLLGIPNTFLDLYSLLKMEVYE